MSNDLAKQGWLILVFVLVAIGVSAAYTAWPDVMEPSTTGTPAAGHGALATEAPKPHLH